MLSSKAQQGKKPTWYEEVASTADLVMHVVNDRIDLRNESRIADSAILDESNGIINIGSSVIIDDFVKIVGPCYIGDGTIIGTGAKVTCSYIDNNCLIGMGGEVKNSQMEYAASIGPYSYLADSIMRERAFFGALVRTSNYRLDGKNVSVVTEDGTHFDTGMRKLGCEVGKNASLGVGCVILPGRVVPERSIFGPGVHITKNLQPGRYMVKQDLSFQPL